MNVVLTHNRKICISQRYKQVFSIIRLLSFQVQQNLQYNQPDVLQEQQISPAIQERQQQYNFYRKDATVSLLWLKDCLFVSLIQSIIQYISQKEQKYFLNELLEQYLLQQMERNIIAQYSLKYLLKQFFFTYINSSSFSLEENTIWQKIQQLVQTYFIDQQLQQDQQNESNEQYVQLKYEAYTYICKKLYKYSISQKANNTKKLIISNIATLATGFRTFQNMNLQSKLMNDDAWIQILLNDSHFYTTICNKKFNVLSNMQFQLTYQLNSTNSREYQNIFVYNNRDINQKISSNIQSLVLEAKFLSKVNVEFEKPEILKSISLKLCLFPDDISKCVNLEVLALSEIECVKSNALKNLTHLKRFQAQKIEMSGLQYNEAVCDRLFKTLTFCTQLEQIFLSECSMSSKFIINYPYQSLKSLQIVGKEGYKVLVLNCSEDYFTKLELLSVYACINIYSDKNVFKLEFEGNKIPANLSFINCANIDDIQEFFQIKSANN